MAKSPELHPYADRASYERVMLLVSAIASNPGIAPSGVEVSPMVALLGEMKAIAHARGMPWKEWSEHTIREDLKELRRFGILREGTAMRSGYYLGKEPPELPPVQRVRKLGRKKKAV
jgi:hypothetical protein